MPAKEHNYVRKVEEFASRLKLTPGQVRNVEVVHDDWCGVFRGERCNCDPEVRLARAGK